MTSGQDLGEVKVQKDDLFSHVKEFMSDTDFLGEPEVSAEGVSFPIKPEILEAAKADVAAEEAPAPVEQPVEEAKPGWWTDDPKYKEIQSFATKKSQEAAEKAKRLAEIEAKAGESEKFIKALEPFYPEFQQWYNSRNFGQPQQPTDPGIEGDPDEAMTRGEARKYADRIINASLEKLKTSFGELLNSDPAYRILREGIDMQQARLTNPEGFDKVAQQVAKLRTKYGFTYQQALAVVEDATGGVEKQTQEASPSKASPNGKPASPAPTSRELNKEEVDARAGFSPTSLGVSPNSLRTGREQRTYSQKLREVMKEVAAASRTHPLAK
jgi:hypothetical protein